jgi:hypothetical protein
MADDLGVQFFTAAKAQHEASAKWHLIVLAVLVYFHLALAGPFAKQTEELGALVHERDQKRILEGQLTSVVGLAEEFTNVVQDSIAKTSGRLREDLVGAFATLDHIIPQLIAMGRERAGGEEGARLFQPSPGIQRQQQQQVAPQPEMFAPTLAVMEPALRIRVVEVAESSNGDLRQLAELNSYISDAIIAPAIQRANDSWSEGLQDIVSMAEEIDGQIQPVVDAAGDAADPLRRLQETVSNLRRNAEELKFAAPPGTAWWGTTGGKDVSIQKMLEKMIQGINQRRNTLEVVKEQAEAAANAIKENDQRAQKVTAELAKLEKQAGELQAQLGAIGEPLKVISLKLSLLAPLLALIIGLGVAALALWRAESLRRMSVAASVVVDAAQDKVIRSWLRSAAGGSPARLLLWELASGAAAAAWIVAAWSATRALPTPLLPSVTVIGLALAAMAAGWAYHWHRAAQALAVSHRD